MLLSDVGVRGAEVVSWHVGLRVLRSMEVLHRGLSGSATALHDKKRTCACYNYLPVQQVTRPFIISFNKFFLKKIKR